MTTLNIQELNSLARKINAVYIKQRNGRLYLEEWAALENVVRGLDTPQRDYLKEHTCANGHKVDLRKDKQRQYAKWLNNNYSKVTGSSNGWYGFSPNGHKYFTSNGDLKVRGFNKLMDALKQYKRFSVVAGEYIGFVPEFS